MCQNSISAGWKPNSHIAQGNALGAWRHYAKSPCKGKSALLQCFSPYMASLVLFLLFPRALPWAMSFCPFRACSCTFDTPSPTPINSCLAVSLHDNICISDAQYYEPGAQQNLWCEILEFWAFGAISLIHSRLCCLWEKCVNNRVVKVALLGCHSACFAAQYFKMYLCVRHQR